MLPVRNNLRRPTSSHHFSSASRFQFQKGFASRCSWKCTSIVLIIVCLLMAVALTYITSKFLLFVRINKYAQITPREIQNVYVCYNVIKKRRGVVKNYGNVERLKCVFDLCDVKYF